MEVTIFENHAKRVNFCAWAYLVAPAESKAAYLVTMDASLRTGSAQRYFKLKMRLLKTPQVYLMIPFQSWRHYVYDTFSPIIVQEVLKDTFN